MPGKDLGLSIQAGGLGWSQRRYGLEKKGGNKARYEMLLRALCDAPALADILIFGNKKGWGC